MGNTPSLSVIDVYSVAEVPRVARRLDDLGYHRYWTTEHRSGGQSASPIVLAAVAAASSRRIRIGTAGIKLRYASPRKVAEDFRALEAVYPGRMDLGLISGREANPIVHRQLLDGRNDAEPDYARKLEELTNLVRGQQAPQGPRDHALPNPLNGVPEIWGCGLSHRSGSEAARLGISFAFNLYFARGRGEADALDVLAHYRSAFVPGDWQSEPRTVIVCFGTCAESRSDAEVVFNRQFSRADDAPIVVGGLAALGETPQPIFLGTPAECRDQLLSVAERYHAKELVVQCLSATGASRMRQYELLADAFDFSERTA